MMTMMMIDARSWGWWWWWMIVWCDALFHPHHMLYLSCLIRHLIDLPTRVAPDLIMSRLIIMIMKNKLRYGWSWDTLKIGLVNFFGKNVKFFHSRFGGWIILVGPHPLATVPGRHDGTLLVPVGQMPENNWKVSILVQNNSATIGGSTSQRVSFPGRLCSSHFFGDTQWFSFFLIVPSSHQIVVV